MCVIDLYSREFAPRLIDVEDVNAVEDVANYILQSIRGKHVGKLWAHRLVQRQPELKTRI